MREKLFSLAGGIRKVIHDLCYSGNPNTGHSKSGKQIEYWTFLVGYLNVCGLENSIPVQIPISNFLSHQLSHLSMQHSIK